MEEIPVTVRNAAGDFRKDVGVPPEMAFREFREAAQKIEGRPGVPCTLVREKDNQAMNDEVTFQDAAIYPGTVFVLTYEDEGG